MVKLYIVEDRLGVKRIYSTEPIEVVELICGNDLDDKAPPLNVATAYAHQQLVSALRNSNHVYDRWFDHKKGDWSLADNPEKF